MLPKRHLREQSRTEHAFAVQSLYLSGINALACQIDAGLVSGQHAVRCGALTEWDTLDLAGRGIEPAEDTGMLAGVPNGAVRCGRNIVRMIIGRDRVILDFCRRGSAGT
jgi:hypothetical protein